MKILLFGKGGQVGWELQRSLAPPRDLTMLDFDNTANKTCRSHCPTDGRRANCVHV